MPLHEKRRSEDLRPADVLDSAGGFGPTGGTRRPKGTGRRAVQLMGVAGLDAYLRRSARE